MMSVKESHQAVPTRERPPFSNGRRESHSVGVLVVGAGVSGLTTALCLRRRGYKVTVIAEKFAPNVVSVVAGALWEFPPAVCGFHLDQTSLARSKQWCLASYKVFEDLAHNPDTGVFLRPVTFYFRQPVEATPGNFAKMIELREKVKEFEHDPALAAAAGLNPHGQWRDAYSHLAPMIDTDAYLPWLMEEVQLSGCRLEAKRISGNLRGQQEVLLKQYHACMIVNCAGLGAAELADDVVYPLRGALIRVRNDGRRMPRVTQAHCVAEHENGAKQSFIFIVPRGRDMLLLGGLAEPDEWNLDIGLHNYEPVREMLRRCIAFMPALGQAEIDPTESVRVGLRPMRPLNVRVEHQPGTCIIHNYGHGGSGVTFSWGCAQDVTELVQELARLR